VLPFAWRLMTIVAIATLSGCSWSDFWSPIFYGVNGDGHRADHAANRDYEFQQQYEQQSKMAQEYYQK